MISFQRKQPVPKTQQIILFAYYHVYILITAVDKIWVSGKFHPVLCVEQET